LRFGVLCIFAQVIERRAHNEPGAGLLDHARYGKARIQRKLVRHTCALATIERLKRVGPHQRLDAARNRLPRQLFRHLVRVLERVVERLAESTDSKFDLTSKIPKPHLHHLY